MQVELIGVLKGISGMLAKAKSEDAHVDCAKIQLDEVIAVLEPARSRELPVENRQPTKQEEKLSDPEAQQAKDELTA